MPSFLTALFICMAFLLSHTAPAQAQSSYTGATQGFVGQKNPTPRAVPPVEYPQATPSNLPPVFDNVAPPNLPATTASGEGSDAVEDPCSAYTDSYDSYTLCQDRIQKIQRMKDAKSKRQANDAKRYGTPAPAPVATEEPKTDAPAADAKTADGTEEKPKELTPTEKALEMRGKAVEKKSIGVK